MYEKSAAADACAGSNSSAAPEFIRKYYSIAFGSTEDVIAFSALFLLLYFSTRVRYCTVALSN